MARIYKREGSKFYYICFRDNFGRLVRRSTGTTEQDQAERLLMEVEAELLVQRRRFMPQDECERPDRIESEEDLKRRLLELEQIVRRLCIHQSFQARMFAEWGRFAGNVMPAKWRSPEARFFAEEQMEEERDDG